MTQEEKDQRINALEEELLVLSAKMRQSDAHASKCIKLGLVYKDTYPEEYVEYEQARERYNEAEVERINLIRQEVEEVMNGDNEQGIN